MGRPIRDYYIVNRVFWFHSRVSVFIMATLSLIVTLMEWFDDAINCIANGAPVSGAVQEYCWTHSTFTGPGKGHVRHNGYYQWVSTVLLVQSICFAVPGFVWRILEKGRVQALMHRLGGPTSSDERDADAAVDYLLNPPSRFIRYALRCFLCELLNLINVAGQMVFVNYFLDFYFTGPYGALDLGWLFAKRPAADPIDRVLPKMAICSFNLQTPTGAVVPVDAVCKLPVNVVNEKSFLFLWFWLGLMAIVSSINVLNRMKAALSSRFRMRLLKRWTREVSAADVEIVVSKCDIGVWFFLNQLHKNLRPNVFDRTVSKLADKLRYE